jgi:hypothetical protein
MSDNTNKKDNNRCPNGTRKNPKTGNCDPITDVKKKYNAIRKNRVTKKKKNIVIVDEFTVPVVPIPEPMPMPMPMPEPVIMEEPILPPTIKKPLPKKKKRMVIVDEFTVPVEPEPPQMEEPIPPATQKDGKPARCPNGYRMNKTTKLCDKLVLNKTQNKTKKKRTEEKTVIGEPIPRTDIQQENPASENDIQEEQPILEVPDVVGEVVDEEEEKEDLQNKILLKMNPMKNDYLQKREKLEYQEELANESNTYDFLYPTLNDPNFNIKIAKRKEFFTNQYDGKIYDVRKQANILCNAQFELLPHQLFVKKFLSFQTPYNSLLLYHGLGTGKTCSAIGIAEEMRSYNKQIGIKHRIIVVASPNVQANFKLQLFDERKLKKISNPGTSSTLTASEDDIWNLETCIGNSLIKEINPANLKGLTREKVISQIGTIINSHYVFMGYGQLANYISNKTQVDEEIGYNDKKRAELEIKKIKQVFNNRLIIVDEVHNIRLTDENSSNKKVASLLMKVSQHAENMRLLLLSATPMFNSYKEIIWLTNLMNINDKRSTIETADIFEKDGTFREPKQLADGSTSESGKDLLKRKLTGYVSYVRGENPYTFPFRIYPDKFAIENTFPSRTYPTIQMNWKEIDEPIKHIKLYLNSIEDYQKIAYSSIINNLRKKSYNSYSMYGEMREMPTFENMEAFGYTLLQTPLSALNIIYPNTDLDKVIRKFQEEGKDKNVDDDYVKEENDIISKSVGSQGLENIMKWESTFKPQPIRHNFEYKPSATKKYGYVFEKETIKQYSSKISKICESIQHSRGIVLIYSQFIDGGIIPIALALEEMGMTRYSTQSSHNKQLFKKRRGEPIDVNTFKTRSDAVADGDDFVPARYIMITGDKTISPANAADIKVATNSDNKYGEKIKVILVSKAGSEGLDFKNIRQVHVLEPWYNMNRIEQIIGRAVRNLSHCQLPFEERNVEIFLHGTMLDNEEEAADLYVYRLAEKKALQIGKVTRLLKELSVDCILNIGQTNFSVEKFSQMAENQNIQLTLSNTKVIDFVIGDQPFTDICDYMDNCEHKCSPDATITEDMIVKDTYNIDYVKINGERIIERIRDLFKEQVFYKRDVLINAINVVKQYPIEEIYYALTYFIANKNEYLFDKYGRTGNLVNKGEYYIFQPIEITDENASILERSIPVNYKRSSIQLELPKSIKKEDAAIQEKAKAKAKGTKKSLVVGKQKAQKEDIPIPEYGETEYGETDYGEKEYGETTYPMILEKFKQNYNMAFSINKIRIGTGEKNRYIHANHVIDHIESIYGIPRENVEKYMIYHMLDMLLLNDKITILNALYVDPKVPLMDPIEIKIEMYIENYFEERKMEENGRTCILLNKENGWKIFMKPDEYSDTDNWEEGEPEDYVLFNKQLDKYVIDDDKINDIVGFINLFKNREMVFKIKDVRQARNNTGARCGDSTTKSESIKLLNILLGSTMYDDSTEFMNFGLCVMIEILMRYFTDIQKDGKVYFLTPEETAVNDIAKFTKR